MLPSKQSMTAARENFVWLVASDANRSNHCNNLAVGLPERVNTLLIAFNNKIIKFQVLLYSFLGGHDEFAYYFSYNCK